MIPDCTGGNFGTGCVNRCNCNDTREVCDPEDGFCMSGCHDGYTGRGCLIGMLNLISKFLEFLIIFFSLSKVKISSSLQHVTMDGGATIVHPSVTVTTPVIISKENANVSNNCFLIYIE